MNTLPFDVCQQSWLCCDFSCIYIITVSEVITSFHLTGCSALCHTETSAHSEQSRDKVSCLRRESKALLWSSVVCGCFQSNDMVKTTFPGEWIFSYFPMHPGHVIWMCAKCCSRYAVLLLVTETIFPAVFSFILMLFLLKPKMWANNRHSIVIWHKLIELCSRLSVWLFLQSNTQPTEWAKLRDNTVVCLKGDST